MWVIFKKTYAGELGMFFAGLKYDLPESVLKLLKKARAKIKKCLAPWDEHKDAKTITKAEAKQMQSDAEQARIDAVNMFEHAIGKEAVAEAEERLSQAEISKAKAYVALTIAEHATTAEQAIAAATLRRLEYDDAVRKIKPADKAAVDAGKL